jgi:ATP-binding cassette subfamily E protein 1
LCLGKPADYYLLDEPSAYLDVEQRIVVAKVIKRYIYAIQKTCLVVEHDFLMSTYLADKIIVFHGTPGVQGFADEPQSLTSGMNDFLKMMDITFRRDGSNYRPRINKADSQMDIEQKKSGNHFHNEVLFVAKSEK